MSGRKIHSALSTAPVHTTRSCEQTQNKAGEPEALVVGAATIDGVPVTLAVSDFEFLGASMGSVYGEKLVRAVESAADRGTPLLTVSSSGGARMHEGLFSLMQMAKTVAALARLGRAGVPHIALLADPCYGGVTASYATVADVVLAEPGALIGFAGPQGHRADHAAEAPRGISDRRVSARARHDRHDRAPGRAHVHACHSRPALRAASTRSRRRTRRWRFPGRVPSRRLVGDD